MKQFEELLKHMPKIADVVNGFKCEAVQAEAYRTLIGTLGFEVAAGETSTPDKDKAEKHGPRRKRRPSDVQDSDAFDVNSFANKMKGRKDFAKLSAVVLHTRDLWDKIRLVLFLSDSQLTSGEIHRILASLNIKTSRGSLSNKLKAMNTNLMTSEPRRAGAVVRYKLSAPAKDEAEKWMNEIVK